MVACRFCLLECEHETSSYSASESVPVNSKFYEVKPSNRCYVILSM